MLAQPEDLKTSLKSSNADCLLHDLAGLALVLDSMQIAEPCAGDHARLLQCILMWEGLTSHEESVPMVLRLWPPQDQEQHHWAPATLFPPTDC